jgi:hypothetical protein
MLVSLCIVEVLMNVCFLVIHCFVYAVYVISCFKLKSEEEME